MKTIAVIAEFDPFHNGHHYMLQKAKELSGADYVIVLMSGDFLQRGVPAMFDKYTRAQSALLGGADLVLELPAAAACSSAQRFAEGAAAQLEALSLVDELWFGSESGRIEDFLCLAEILTEEPEAYRTLLQQKLAAGLSFPAARSAALEAYLTAAPSARKPFALCSSPGAAAARKTICDTRSAAPAPGTAAAENAAPLSLLSRPNDILGLEYVLALKRRNLAAAPRTLQRIGRDYADKTPDPEGFSSAASVRASVTEYLQTDEISGLLLTAAQQIPEKLRGSFLNRCTTHSLVLPDDLSSMLQYRLACGNAEDFAACLDVSPDLADAIENTRYECRSFTAYADLLHTRNRTLTQVRRTLLHILLNLKESDLADALHPSFLRMLGMREGALPLLSAVKKSSRIPLVSNPAALKNDAYAKDLFASNLHTQLLTGRSKAPFVHEYSRKFLRVGE